MFTVNKKVALVVSQGTTTELATADGGCHLEKGERVSALEITSISGQMFYALRKKSQKLILFKPETFGSFNNFLGAF